MLDEDGNAETLVARVVGNTSVAFAADGRNACRSTCTEKREIHSFTSDAQTHFGCDRFDLS